MIQLNGVTKRYGDLTAVDDLDLEIAAGEVFGLLGPNGAGKTTTIEMMVGLRSPDVGTVDLNDQGSPTKPAVRRSIGVATQSLSLYEEVSAETNLRFFGKLYGLRGAALESHVERALAIVGLNERRRGRVATYSGGMKRRLNIAVAMIHDPEILVLDEPTVGVDPQSRNAILESVGALRDAGKTVVYTTHYMEEAERLCDRVAIMDHGKVLALDTVEGLVSTHASESRVRIERHSGVETLTTESPLATLQAVIDDANVIGVRVDRPSLESVFLNLTGRSLRDE